MAFNLLIVDDSGTMRAVIKKTIGATGLQVGKVHEAGDGKEALEVLEQEWVDVILSDINMPQMGGMELLNIIKQDDVLRSIPVIFISTESSQTRMDQAESLGVSAYVKKPFQPEMIKEILVEVLNKAYAVRMTDEYDEQAVMSNDDDLDF